MFNVAEAKLTKSGVNVTFTEQLAPGARLAPHVVQKENEPGLIPVKVIFPVGNICAVELLIVTACAAPGVKILRVWKLRALGSTLIPVPEFVVSLT
jgi:hypothetical protein